MALVLLFSISVVDAIPIAGGPSEDPRRALEVLDE
jgi:hypothetical protein